MKRILVVSVLLFLALPRFSTAGEPAKDSAAFELLNHVQLLKQRLVMLMQHTIDVLLAPLQALQAGANGSGAIPESYFLPTIAYPFTPQLPLFSIRALQREFGNGRVRIGFAVGYPYIGFVKGKDEDYDTDLSYLDESLAAAVASSSPIFVHLNGHRWTEYSRLTDYLFSDSATVAHTQDRIPLTELPEFNAFPRPSGAALWSLNIFNTLYRYYKKKNVQQVATRLAHFAMEHPSLFAGVSIDSEISLCPEGLSRLYSFDYNELTVVQWRYWLSGTKGSYERLPHANPYADGEQLAGHGLNLTLAEVNAKYGSTWESWEEVQPPLAQRDSMLPEPGVASRLWDDWLHFKATLVHQMIADTIGWIASEGLPRDKIYSHQPADMSRPSEWAFCGIPFWTAQVEGAGYGVSVYGLDVTAEALFKRIRHVNANWGIVEWNPLDRSSHAWCETLQLAHVNGARVVSPHYFYPSRIDARHNVFENPGALDGIRQFFRSRGRSCLPLERTRLDAVNGGGQ
jgi:hypothetical protein